MAVQKGADKWKLKKWFNVYAPNVFNNAMIGEMPAKDDAAAIGRTIVLNLDYITHNPAHAYTNVILKVTGTEGEAAHTSLVRMEMLNSYLRSFIRRNRSISAAVIPATTKDGVSIVVKLIAVTRQRTEHTKIKGLRKAMNDYIKAYFKETTLDEAINSIMEGKFQADVASKLMHIADLNKVEIKRLEIVKGQRTEAG
jgi:small subunit ribosomal protein S3Ae